MTTIHCTKKTPSTLVRPQYSPGQLLNDGDLTLAVDYTRGLARLLFRSLLGSGVIAGLAVKPASGSNQLNLTLTVEPGVALDPHGDPLHLITPTTIVIGPACDSELPSQLWVLARRYDRQCTQRSAVCSPENDDAASIYTRLQDGVEIGVYSILPPGVNCCAPADAIQAPAPVAEPVAATAPVAPIAPLIPLTTPAEDSCHAPHYGGIYNDGNFDAVQSEWIPLAKLNKDNQQKWKADHSVRRFIRPAMIDDPQVIQDRR